MTKTVACSEIAMRGTTANHHSLVRHQTIAHTMTPTAMTYSVLPIIDMNFVMVFQVSVRPSSNDVLIPFSHFENDDSGPFSRNPKPTMRPNRSTAGSTARTK